MGGDAIHVVAGRYETGNLLLDAALLLARLCWRASHGLIPLMLVREIF